jgi:hypothetical protein
MFELSEILRIKRKGMADGWMEWNGMSELAINSKNKNVVDLYTVPQYVD